MQVAQAAPNDAPRSRYKLHQRCRNCLRDSFHPVPPTASDGSAIDRFLREREAAGRQFVCEACPSDAVAIVGILRVREEEACDA